MCIFLLLWIKVVSRRIQCYNITYNKLSPVIRTLYMYICVSQSVSVYLPPLHICLCMSLTAGSLNQQCCLAGLGAARADLIFVADSACKYAFVPFHCGQD